MEIINTKLMYENLVTRKIIEETKMGLIYHFCFNCSSKKAILRIKKDGKIIGEVKSGEYFTSYISKSKELIKTDSKGQWEFIVYLLEAHKGVDVVLTISKERLPNNVYYGDLHSHSICSSDAVNTFEEIENKVVSIGNDFHAITDHNSYAMNFQFSSKKSNVEFIYGVEMTNRFGHYNFLGKEMPFESCNVNDEIEFINKLLFHKKNGGYVTFNHPFSPKSRVCILPITHTYCDFLEVWNGPWATHNKIALKWWHKKLLDNVFFPICGGSDTHNIADERNYGNPTNCIIAPYNEQGVLLSQLKKGHCYLISTPKIIEVIFENIIFGDVTEKEIIKLTFKSKKDYKIKVITNLDNKVYFINNIPSEFEMKGYTFIRFEGYDEDECVFISNPIFSNKFSFNSIER